MHLKEYRALLARYLRPLLRLVLLLTLLLCVDTALLLINPQLLRVFIDAVTSSGFQNGLLLIGGLFIAVAVLQQGVKIAITYCSERVGWSATNTLRSELALHLVRLDLSFHKQHTPGEMIERVDGDVNDLANFFSQFVIRIVGNLLLLLGVLVVLIIQDWRSGLVLSGFAVLALLLVSSVRNVATKRWKTYRQAVAELYGFLEERLTGTEDIRSSGAQAYVLHRLFSYTRQRFLTGRRARVTAAITWTMPILASALGTVVAFVLIAWLYSAGSMTLGLAFLIYYYTQLILQPLQALSDQLNDFQKASAGLARISELLQVKSELKDGPGVQFPSGALSVEFDGVSFGYGEEKMVLKDISFRLKPGEVLGLLGRTGSGKTTITRLLFRLYDPDSGCIQLGGHDLPTAQRHELRNAIGMVTQDVQLFHASVRDNLTFFDPAIEDSRILQVIEDIGLLPWYKALPEGLDSMLAAGGGGLSAGEAQLLAFARVFLRDPAVVILDEASSRLDPTTEHLLEQAIDRLLRDRTAIIIAHRLSTVQRADSILILDNGSTREYGPRTQLAADSTSYFSHLLHAAHEEVAR